MRIRTTILPSSTPPMKTVPPPQKAVSQWVKEKLDTKRRDKAQKQLEKRWPEAKIMRIDRSQDYAD